MNMMGSSNNGGGVIDPSSWHVDGYFIHGLPLRVKELIAGGAAGAIAKTAVAPLERIKILLQARSEGFSSMGVHQSLRKIVEYEGIRGLYRGNGASVLRVIPYSGLHYATYEQYRSWILQNCPSFGTGPFVDLLAGSAAGGTAVLCTYPLDLARTRLAYQVVNLRQTSIDGVTYTHSRPAYDGIQDVFKKVYKEGGVRSFYRGVGPTIIGILPYAGLKYYIYEELKREVPPGYQDSIMIRLGCGAAAGLVGQTFTYPLDVVRRQMQVDYVQQGESRYRSTVHGITSIVRRQGWTQLYAGLSVNYLKAVPSVAIGFTTYDVMKSWLHALPE